MKILFIMPYHPNLADIVAVLQNSKHTVTIASHRLGHIPTQAGFKKLPVARWSGPPIYNPWVLWRVIRTHDCVVLKHTYTIDTIVPLLLSAFQHKPAIIMTQYSEGQQVWLRKLWIKVTNVLVRLTKAGIIDIVQPSPAAATARCAVRVPAPVSAARFTQKTAWKSARPIRVLTVAKAQPRKNIDVLIKALYILQGNHSHNVATLNIVGTTANVPARQRELNHLKKMIVRYNLLDAVTIVDLLSPKEMEGLYSEFDIFVLPATSEPLGYAIVEAMAAGLPIICSSECGGAAYVDQNQNGYILTTITPQTVADCLAQFLTSKQTPDIDKLKQFGSRSRAQINQVHDPVIFLHALESTVRCLSTTS